MLPHALLILPTASGSHSQAKSILLYTRVNMRPAVHLRPHDGSVAGCSLPEGLLWMTLFFLTSHQNVFYSFYVVLDTLAWFACLRSLSPSLQSLFPHASAYSILITEHFSSKAVLFFVFAFSLMVVFKLRFVFYSGRCNDGVINVWVWVGKAVTGED